MNKKQITTMYIAIVLTIGLALGIFYYFFSIRAIEYGEKYTDEVKSFERDYEDMEKMQALSDLCDKRWDDLPVQGRTDGRDWDDLSDDIDEYIKDYERYDNYNTSFGNSQNDSVKLELFKMKDDLTDSKNDIEESFRGIGCDTRDIFFPILLILLFLGVSGFLVCTWNEKIKNIEDDEPLKDTIVMIPEEKAEPKTKKKVDWKLGKSEGKGKEFRKLF